MAAQTERTAHTAGARARAASRSAGPPLGAPARAGRGRAWPRIARRRGVDRESVLAEGAAARDAKVRATYDAVATAYADRLGDELDRKPFDRWLLDRVAGLADGSPVVDVGTGPGHVAAYLAAAGADVTGVDLSPGMVEEARGRFPDLTFNVGNLTGLLRPPAAAGWGAITAWYALVHLAGSELAPGRRLPHPRARPRRLAGPGPARRRRRAPRRGADGPAGRRRLRAARPRRRCSRPCAPPGSSTSSGTCAGRTPAPRSRPSGSTCSRGGRPPRAAAASPGAARRRGSRARR